MTLSDRPLSPHLQVYRLQLTSVLSITHRLTGIALAVGTPLFIVWLATVAAGADVYEAVRGVIGSWVGRLVLFAWTAALFFHLCNGIRHLFWDAGLGFELTSAYRSGWTVVAATAGLTLLSWVAGYAAVGAF